MSTYSPSVGWIDLDPVNNLVPGEHHVTVAYGRDYGDVTPVRGVLVGGGRQRAVRVSVDVAPLEEAVPSKRGERRYCGGGTSGGIVPQLVNARSVSTRKVEPVGWRSAWKRSSRYSLPRVRPRESSIAVPVAGG